MAAAREMEVLVMVIMEIRVWMRLGFWVRRCLRRVVGKLVFERISMASSITDSSLLFKTEVKNSIDSTSYIITDEK